MVVISQTMLLTHVRFITTKTEDNKNERANEMDKRVCIKCSIAYPLQEKYFSLAHGSTTRYLTKCRECIREYQEEYRIKKQEEQGEIMHEIKEIPDLVKKRNLVKAINHIHLQAFGEQLMENIYWCKKDDCVQITDSICGKCDKTMEKIGFVDYSEDDK